MTTVRKIVCAGHSLEEAPVREGPHHAGGEDGPKERPAELKRDDARSGLGVEPH